MFLRTSSGLSSEHLFHGVSLVVYCEGLPSEGEGCSLDELFWSVVLSQNGISAHCKSQGAKPDLLKIAATIIQDDIKHVAIAMDRDYDSIRGTALNDSRALYTYGYSWESDTFSDFNHLHVITLFATTSEKPRISQDLKKYLDKNATKLRRLAALDFKYISSPTPLFDRKRPMSILHAPKNSEPAIKVQDILNSAREIGRFQTGPIQREHYQQLDGLTAFYGKAVARLVYHWLTFRTRKISTSRTVHFDAFAATAIETLSISHANSKRNEHYKAMLAKLPVIEGGDA